MTQFFWLALIPFLLLGKFTKGQTSDHAKPERLEIKK